MTEIIIENTPEELRLLAENIELKRSIRRLQDLLDAAHKDIDNLNGEGTVEKVTYVVSYRIRWEDGEAWRVNLNSGGGAATTYTVYDPEGHLLRETDPMHIKLINIVRRHNDGQS